MATVRSDLAVTYAVSRPAPVVVEPPAPVLRGTIATPAAPARPRVGLGVKSRPSAAPAAGASSLKT